MKRRTEKELIEDILIAVKHDSPYGELKTILRTEFSLIEEEHEAQLKAQDEEIIRCVKTVDRLKSKLLHKKWDAIEFRHLFLSTKFSKNKKFLTKKHKRLEQ